MLWKSAQGGGGGVDGTLLYIIDNGDTEGHEYSQSAWDVSTASLTDSPDISSIASKPTALSWYQDGSGYSIIDYNNADVVGVDANTAWDLSDFTTTNRSLDTSGETSFAEDIQWFDSGNKLVVCSEFGDIYTYEVGAGSVYNEDDLSYTGNSYTPANDAQNASTVEGFAFNDDETKFYVGSGDTIYTFTLSTAADFSSTITYKSGQDYDTSGEFNSAVESLYMRPNDEELFALSEGGKAQEYELSTPGDPSTASPAKSLDTSTDTNDVRGMDFGKR